MRYKLSQKATLSPLLCHWTNRDSSLRYKKESLHQLTTEKGFPTIYYRAWVSRQPATRSQPEFPAFHPSPATLTAAPREYWQ